MTNTKSKQETLPPGLYFIGDLTYLTLSEKDNEQYLWGEDGVLTSESGEQFAKFSIGNDGIYRDNDGFEYGVDAASIGVYPITSVAEVDTALGRGVEFFEEITVAFDEELGLVRFGEIEIELVDVALLGEPLTRPEGMSDLDWLRERAKAEDSAAQYELYEKLKGDPETHKEATKWMFAAARGGHSIAQYDAGCLRKYGEGDVVPHYPDAVKWLRLSAEQGDASAQYELGDSYENGLGVEEDSEEAVKWFLHATAVDPLSLTYSASAAHSFYYNGLYDEGLEFLKKPLSENPMEPLLLFMKGMLLSGKGEYDQAIDTFTQRETGGKNTNWMLAYSMAKSGRSDEVNDILEFHLSKRKFSYVPPYMIATIYAGLGDDDNAIKWLAEDLKDGGTGLFFVNLHHDPKFTHLKGRAEFQGFLDTIK